MSTEILGIDIRRHHLTAVLTRSGLKGSWIDQIMTVPVAPPTEEEDAMAPVERALEELSGRIIRRDATCVISLPADWFSFRNIQIPFKDNRKIRQVLPFELEPTLPHPVDELLLDFQNIRLPSHAEGAHVIAAAIEKWRVGAIMAPLIRLRMAPERITVGGSATAACLARRGAMPENCLLLDIDADHCTIFILISGKICLVRPFPMHPGMDPDQRSKNLVANIRRTLSAFEELFHLDYSPEEVYITGWGVADLDFENRARAALGVPIKAVDLAAETRMVQKVRDPEAGYAPARFDNALSLALAEADGLALLDLRKGPFAPRRRIAEYRSSLIGTGILLLLTVGILLGNFLMEVNAMERRMAEMDGRIREIFQSAFPQITRIVDPLHQMRVALQEAQQSALGPGSGAGDARSIDILNELSRRTPPAIDVILDRMVIGEDSTLISGSTDTFNAVDEIQNGLSGGELFKKVTISSTNKERTGNRIEFKMRISLK